MTTATTRPPGRRAGTRANPGRTALLSLMLIGLTLGMLTLAGTTPRGIGRPVEDPSRVALDQRVFSCAGGLPSTTVRSGAVGSGLAAPRTVADTPVGITVGRGQAEGAFAGQQARTARSLAWGPCPEPRSRWWFVGAGGAAVTHDTRLTLTNTRTGAAVVDVDVFGPAGLVDSPGLHGLTIGPGASRVFDLAKTAPAVGNLAVRVIARRGLVAASATDGFSPSGGVGKETAEWLPAQSAPSRDVTLAGIPQKPGSATLVVVNPGQVDAIVKLRVIGATGTFAPTSATEFTVAPDTVANLPIAPVIDGAPMAVRLTSSGNVSATIRSVADGDTAFATGVRAISGTTAFAVPDGASGRLVLSSLQTGATVRATVFDARGNPLLEKTVVVAPATSQALPLGAKSAYVQLIADKPDVIAGFSVTATSGKPGIASAGVTPAIRSIRLPKVNLGW